jgi:hypothetical protein
MLRSLARVLGLCLVTASLLNAFGCASDDSPPAAAGNRDDFGDEVRSKSDEQVKAEIEAAAKGAIYVSESDEEFTFVSAPLAASERASITEELVRAKLAKYVDENEDADKPMASLHAQSETWASWKSDSVGCTEDTYPGPEECAATQKLNEALDRNLRGIKVFYFGAHGSPGNVDGVAVTVFVVGRTPQGNLAGVKTIAIWT